MHKIIGYPDLKAILSLHCTQFSYITISHLLESNENYDVFKWAKTRYIIFGRTSIQINHILFDAWLLYSWHIERRSNIYGINTSLLKCNS